MKNIIYIHSHDTGRYIQPYGYAVPTPHLMALAEEGTLFRQAYCAAPTCSPSRAALLTGTAPHVNGMMGLTHRGFRLNDYSQHLSHYLADNGYETVLCGVQHETTKDIVDETLGYTLNITSSDFVKAERDRFDLSNAQAVADYLQQPKDKPFFLALGFNNTHRDFPENHEGINENYVLPPYPLYDNAQNRKDMASYMASARVLDESVGIVMKALEQSGHEEDTILFFTTDHGIAFPHMKCNLQDSGIGISLIFKYPGNPTKGEAIDALVSHLDVYPTLCEMTGLTRPNWLEGRSMLPLFNGEAEQIRDEIFSEVTYHAAYEPMRCIRTDRYKYIYRFDDEYDGVVPSNIDNSRSKQFLLDHGLFERKIEKEQLYDLFFDPTEGNNVADHLNYKTIKQDLSSRLRQWMSETDDPLLKGKVPKPEGAKICKKTSIQTSDHDYE